MLPLNRLSLENRMPASASSARQTGTMPVRRDPSFSGVTGNLQGRHWVEPETFHKLLNVSSTPYIGKLPKDLVGLVPESPKQVYQALDELASLLLEIGGVDGVQLKFRIGGLKTPVFVQHIGGGGYGRVYRLIVDNQSFALKVYYPSADAISSYGIFGESATGIYFSKKRMKDLSRFCCGNPKVNWNLFEFIMEEMSSKLRKGKSIKDFNVVLFDDVPRNRINGILVDYGGIEKKLFGKQESTTGDSNVSSGSNDSSASEEDSSPQQEPLILRNIADYKKVMATKNKTIQEDASCLISQLPLESRMEAYVIAMATSDPDIQAMAASRIDYFWEESQPLKSAFDIAMATNHPKVQSAAASRIHCLSKEFIKPAFCAAMATNHPDVQAIAASRILAFPDALKKEALQMYIRAKAQNGAFQVLKELEVLPL